MVNLDYGEIAKVVRLGPREIARRAGATHPTVIRLLAGENVILGSQKRKRIYDAIEEEARRVQQNLERLMGPAAR